MKHGAYDYISKPFKPDEVLLTLRKAEERESLKRENRRLKARIEEIEKDFAFGDMVGRSPGHVGGVRAGAQSGALLNHRPHPGRERDRQGADRARHSHRGRACRISRSCPSTAAGFPRPCSKASCSATRKGAFTGADRNKKGLFQEADGGTIFLDEIGELPLSLQVKLLRVLQENEVRPVGEAKATRVDVRVIAATAKQLDEEVRQGRFREDLYYRLNVLPITLPPLRHRPEDVPHLCRHFLERFNRKLGKIGPGHQPGRHGAIAGVRLAGKRARARKRHRTRGAAGRGRPC